MGAGIRIGVDISAGQITFPAFAQTDWEIIHNDLKATAESSAVLLRPGSYSNSNVYPVRVPLNGVRMMARVRYATAISAISTEPVIAFYGAYGPDTAFNESTGVFDDTGLVRWVRLDIASSGSTAGTSMSTEPTTDIRDGTWKYGLITGEASGTNIQFGAGFDTRGAKWVMALVSTAATGLTGAGDVQLEAAFLTYQPMGYAQLA